MPPFTHDNSRRSTRGRRGPGNEHYRRSWYWYDWANSAFVTTVGTVLFAPYLTTVAEAGRLPRPRRRADLYAPTSTSSGVWHRRRDLVAPFTVTVATIVSAVVR